MHGGSRSNPFPASKEARPWPNSSLAPLPDPPPRARRCSSVEEEFVVGYDQFASHPWQVGTALDRDFVIFEFCVSEVRCWHSGLSWYRRGLILFCQRLAHVRVHVWLFKDVRLVLRSITKILCDELITEDIEAYLPRLQEAETCQYIMIYFLVGCLNLPADYLDAFPRTASPFH